MGDPEEGDAGVHVGGDAPGGVRLAARRTPRKPGRGARARRRNLIVSGSLSAAILAGTGWVWATPRQIGSVDAGLGAVEQAPRGAMNILLVGVDKRDDLTRKEQNRLRLGREVGERTDTMMVIHLSEDHRKATVVSLPRDTWTTIPGQGQHKVNSAYQFGGAKLAVKTVQQLTGLPISRYIEVNVLGFVDVVDRLGGVTVCTPVPINDPKTGLNLRAGTHRLDGAKALGYARTRATARSDLDRIDRQQQVISAMLSEALSNPANLISFVNASLATIKVDPDDGLVPLVEQLKDVSLNDVKFAGVPLANVDFKTPTGESAVLWDKERAADLFRRIAADQDLAKPAPKPSPTPTLSRPTVPPEQITVKVLNGTLITGLGARTKAGLVDYGFKVPGAPGNTARKDFKTTLVRHAPGKAEEAKVVAAAIPGAQLKEADVKGIEVVIGQDQLKVRKPKSAATPSVSPSPQVTPTTRTASQNICKKEG
ncbi:LCP family protein [Nonomuraea sp. NPDC049152]|uniref:LCP family protein n=1 Tax=Nonomuraea sp. NPDC049152 TaxID=3154350 RepID=UPI0033F320DD